MLPIFCAIDTTDLSRAKQLALILKPHITGIKLGLEFFTYHGPAGVKAISQLDIPIFLDLKFHDIPNTIAGAIRSAMELNIQMLTIHTIGGKEMLLRAAETVKNWAEQQHQPAPKVLGVTILTSMDSTNLQEVGINEDIEEQVLRLSTLAQKCGLDGVVCSPHEIALLRQHIDPSFLLVVPGIRPAGNEHSDQKRVQTPQKAIEQGASYLVMGRPLTEAADPIHVLEAIRENLGL